MAAVLAVVQGCSGGKGTDMKVTHLRCEYLENPLGIGVVPPRLSWILESYQRGQVQTAYRILVASSEENLNNDNGDLWDSGKVMSDQTAQVLYGGAGLKSRIRCFWKVCAWDRDGSMTAFSEPAYWTVGLLASSD